MQELNFKDIKSLKTAEIDAKVSEMKKSIFALRMSKTTGGMDKPHQLKIAKKNVAKLLTAKNAKGE